MAKKKQHIDDFFKEQMQGKELPLDGSEWTRLSEALGHEKKKRRGFFWWWFGGIMLIALVVSALFLSEDSANNKLHEAQAAPSAMDQNKPSNDSKVSATENEEQNVIDDNDLKQEAGNSVSSPDINISEPSESNDITNASNEVLSDPRAEEPITSLEPELIISITDQDQQDFVPRVVPERLESILLHSFAYTVHLENVSMPEKEESKIEVSKPSDTYLPLQLIISVGTQINDQSIQHDSAIHYQNYRNTNELNAISEYLSMQLQTEYKGLEFGAGVNYMRKIQSLGNPYSNDAEMKILLYDSIPFVDINFDTTWLPFNYRDSLIRTTSNGQALQRPSYVLIGIPLSVSKNFDLNPKLDLDIGLDLHTLFLINASGNINSYSIKEEEIDPSYLKDFNLTAGLNIGLRYMHNERIGIEWRTGVHTDLNNMSLQSGTRQKFTMYRGSIGIIYKLK